MPVTIACRLALVSCFWLGTAASATAQSHWPINEPPVSTLPTGTVAPPPFAAGEAPAVVAQAGPEAPAQDGEPPEVDESALRYFASRGDTRRLEIEIARLRALYPQWTPPADPLAAPVNVDERLEAVWRLYADGRFAEARRAIAERQAEEADWQPPADLLDRLALAESRERLLNASEIDQYGTVIRIASENPQLLTCGEVDVLWRVAEAFARTERETRAQDAYRYILANCENPQERLATMQNASGLLSQPLVEELLTLERFDEEGGAGEFAPVRDDLARDAVARGGEDAARVVPAGQLERVERLARENRSATDAGLLGWYHLRRENHARAEEWFRMARGIEDDAEISEGLALALVALGNNAEAEDVMHGWRAVSDEARGVYLAAAANLLGEEPRPVLSAEVLARIVAETAAARDVPAGRQLGWYARAWNQHETAGRWFSTALGWDPDDEPSAYGLALTRHLLGDAAGLAEIQRLWAGRSERIQQVGRGATEPAPSAVAVPRQPTPAPVQDATPAPAAAPSAAPAPAPVRAPAAHAPAPAAASHRRSCPAHIHPDTLSPEAALQRGWCLLDLNRPMEAARAFARALTASSQATRRDAAWGQSLAYLRVDLVDEAAVAAAAVPQDAQRANELQTAILAQRALGAFERGRYAEALIALDRRARIAAERIDLMVLRGWSYYHLNRMHDARRIFEAVAGTGNREGLRGLAVLNETGG